MRALATVCGVVFLSQFTVAQDAAATLPFTGVWTPQSSIFGGVEQLAKKESRDMIRLSVAQGEYRLYYLTDPVKMEGRRLATAAFTVDEKAKTFELTFKDGLKKGEKVHGIFELGKADMKICYGPADKPRPTKFESPKGSEVFCESWERSEK